MVITYIYSRKLVNDDWEALEEYLEKSRNEMTVDEIRETMDTLFGWEILWDAKETILYDKTDER